MPSSTHLLTAYQYRFLHPGNLRHCNLLHLDYLLYHLYLESQVL